MAAGTAAAVSFVEPLWLLALLALPLLALGLRAWDRDRRRAATAFADPALLRLSGGPRARRLTILADPFAAAFYEHTGARRVGEAPSDAIPGRLVPFYEIALA